jgi:hypothetical protein
MTDTAPPKKPSEPRKRGKTAIGAAAIGSAAIAAALLYAGRRKKREAETAVPPSGENPETD